MATVNTTETPSDKMERLWRKLREGILSGDIKPGAPLPSERELGKRYKVASATAAGVVTRLATEGLAVRMRGRGSFVAEKLPVEHQILDFIRMRRPPARGEKPGTLSWIERLTHAAQGAGWIPNWHHLTYEELEQIEELVDRFSESKGLIIFEQIPPELPVLLWQRGIPLVTVFSAYADARVTRYPQITFDRREASWMATKYLASLGYSRIGFVRIAPSMREAGFLDAINEKGLALHQDWLLNLGSDINQVGDERHKSCLRLCRELLEGNHRPEAMVCPTIHIAHVLELTALEMGLRVPEDLAIVKAGPEARSIFAEVPVPVTGVGMSVEQTCQRSLELIEQIAGELRPRKSHFYEPIMMPLHLTVQGSCGARLKGVDTKEIGG